MTTDCTTHIHQAQSVEPALLNEVLAHVLRYNNANEVNIHVQARVPLDAPAYKHPGWVEYLVLVDFDEGPRMTVGAIQRSVGAETEFHT